MRKPLDIQFTATRGGLDVDVRGSGPVAAAMLDVGVYKALQRIGMDSGQAATTIAEWRAAIGDAMAAAASELRAACTP